MELISKCRQGNCMRSWDRMVRERARLPRYWREEKTMKLLKVPFHFLERTCWNYHRKTGPGKDCFWLFNTRLKFQASALPTLLRQPSMKKENIMAKNRSTLFLF